jgi:hypothetical protein
MRSAQTTRAALVLGLVLAAPAVARANDLHPAEELFGSFMDSLADEHHEAYRHSYLASYLPNDDLAAIREAWTSAKDGDVDAELSHDGTNAVVTLRRGSLVTATVAFDHRTGRGLFEADGIKVTRERDPESGRERIDVERRGDHSIFKTESRIQAHERVVDGQALKAMHPIRATLHLRPSLKFREELNAYTRTLAADESVWLSERSIVQKEERMASVLPEGLRPEPKITLDQQTRLVRSGPGSWQHVSEETFRSLLGSKALVRPTAGSASSPGHRSGHR